MLAQRRRQWRLACAQSQPLAPLIFLSFYHCVLRWSWANCGACAVEFRTHVFVHSRHTHSCHLWSCEWKLCRCCANPFCTIHFGWTQLSESCDIIEGLAWRSELHAKKLWHPQHETKCLKIEVFNTMCVARYIYTVLFVHFHESNIGPIHMFVVAYICSWYLNNRRLFACRMSVYDIMSSSYIGPLFSGTKPLFSRNA